MGKQWEGALDPNEVTTLPASQEHRIERPGCGHIQVIVGPSAATAVEYAKFIAPVLRAEFEKPCPECAKEQNNEQRTV